MATQVFSDGGRDAALPPHTRRFYQDFITVLQQADVPFLVGGAYALERYTGIARHTKDLDVFLKREDYGAAAATLVRAGYHTELVFPHWLGKAWRGDDFVDLIFSSGNGVAFVDDDWFANAVKETVFDIPVSLCAPEEIIWSKSFIMERERFDGADVAHIIHARAEQMDWERLERRFGEHWRVLLMHLVMFGFVYPAERLRIPHALIAGLSERLLDEGRTLDQIGDLACQGTLLSRAQYLVDIDNWGYVDARLAPRGHLSAEDIANWTAAIDNG